MNQKISFCIREWPEEERPREKMLRDGPAKLSDAELVAILLRSGIKGKGVTSLAQELIIGMGGIRHLLSLTEKDLNSVKGLGPAKKTALLAVAELAKRSLRAQMIGKNYVRDPSAVVDYLYASLRDRKTEVFKVLFLDKGNGILGEEDLFFGTVDEAAVHPREVVRRALEMHATAVILVHNHPSGRIQPSQEDKAVTRKIQEACAAIGIRLLDHLIIGDNAFFSFQEHQLLPS